MMALDFTCLPMVKASSMSVNSCSVGWLLVTTFNPARVTLPLSRVCTRKPPANRTIGQGGRQRIGQAPCRQQAQVLFRRQDLARILIGIGRDDHFGEDLGNLFRCRAVQSLVEGQHAAKGADRIAGQRRQIGVFQAPAQRPRRRDWRA